MSNQADEVCGVCWYNVGQVCQLRGTKIKEQFMTRCGLFKEQTHCVICKLDIQEDEVNSHPNGGRVCRDCCNAIQGGGAECDCLI